MKVINKFLDEHKNIRKWIIKYKNYLILGILGLIVLGILIVNKQGVEDDSYKYFDPVSNVHTNTQAEEVDNSYFVEITGQVAFPGVYEIDKEYMVMELLNLAGGETDKADLKYIHKTLGLSTIVKKEQKIFIPTLSSSVSNSSNNLNTNQVSINHASLSELKTLTGIGEVTAKSIIENRPYSSLEDLTNVTGIGDATYDKIVSQIIL